MRGSRPMKAQVPRMEVETHAINGAELTALRLKLHVQVADAQDRVGVRFGH